MSGGRMVKENKTKLEASYTVEATIIIPLMFFLLFTVIRYAFLLHDELIAEAGTAHAAEEGRMAMQYGRLPYGGGIIREGFEDGDSIDKLTDEIKNAESDIRERSLLGNVHLRLVEVSEKEAQASVRIIPGDVYGVLDPGIFETVDVDNCRKIRNPAKNARLAALIFRAGKKILGV